MIDAVQTKTRPLHPGPVLKELYLIPLDMSVSHLATRLHVPRTRIERLVKGQTAITVDTAMRLARFFSTTPEYWMNLQRAWDLARARETIDVSGIKPLQAT
jgi:addiction module HigA family antidote